MSLRTQTTQTKTESEEMEMKTKEEFGFYIRKTVIKKSAISSQEDIRSRECEISYYFNKIYFKDFQSIQ